MRFDRGTTILTATTAKVGTSVWVPYHAGWVLATIDKVLPSDGDRPAIARVARHDGVIWAYPLWQLRLHKPHISDGGKPDEPVPPTHGAPRGIGLSGVLHNGGVKGRA